MTTVRIRLGDCRCGLDEFPQQIGRESVPALGPIQGEHGHVLVGIEDEV
jgi:hypothetical protein